MAVTYIDSWKRMRFLSRLTLPRASADGPAGDTDGAAGAAPVRRAGRGDSRELPGAQALRPSKVGVAQAYPGRG